jgi:hypothetical protein
MYFDHHEVRRAEERHARLLVEARILRLIRTPQQPAATSQPRQRQSLLARVFAQLRGQPAAHA